MRSFILSLAFLFAATPARADDAAAELQKLQGTWTVVTAQEGGKDQADDQSKKLSIIIARDVLSLKVEGQPKTLDFKLKNEPTAKPKAVDLESTIRKGSVARGIYELSNGSRLTAAESWGRPETLADHFNRHGADFGATSAENYAQQASRFLQESQARGLPTKIDAKGIIRVYDPATNTFGAYNPNGTTATFYKPQPKSPAFPKGHKYPTNEEYWRSQPGDPPWTR